MAVNALYASPLLRWALLLEEHPSATYTYQRVKGVDLPAGHEIPEEYEGLSWFALCTITFPPGTGLEPAYGYKNVDRGVNLRDNKTGPVTTSEQWQQLCTKTLGRALKRCGYPDNMDELRAVIRWRGDLARLNGAAPAPAVGAGSPAAPSLPASVDDALSAARTEDPDESTQADLDDQIVDGEVVDGDGAVGQARADLEAAQARRAPAPASEAPSNPPSGADVSQDVDPGDGDPPAPETLTELREVINACSKASAQAPLREWAMSQGISFARPATEDQARRVIDEALELLDAAGS